jgi:hypothetical protein
MPKQSNVNFLDARTGKAYGLRIPGRIVVHNQVNHRANTRNGTNGFRWWSEFLGEKHAICRCGWQPKEPPHYKLAAGRARLDAFMASSRAARPQPRE